VASQLLILGASARSAAWSALRAGLAPCAVDLFADRDLAEVAPCVRVAPEEYPRNLFWVSEAFPQCPWIFTGGLENRPDLIARLARRRPLWGVDARGLKVARDPVRVSQALRTAGLAALEVRLDSQGVPRDGTWLRKPVSSCGGYGIQAWSGDPERPRGRRRRYYYQSRAKGASLSALFVAERTGRATVVGLTQQLIGRPSSPFAYRGSIGPWPVSAAAGSRIGAIGDALASTFGLVGLFGVDFVLSDDDVPWPVEVNPRYTASVEVIELAAGRALLDAHRRACEGQPLNLGEGLKDPARGFLAKEYVFATQDGEFLAEVDGWGEPAKPFCVPRVADVPRVGTRIAAGEPVLTVFANGSTLEETRARLARATREWEERWRVPVKAS
jgi:predicted ATP-grasp superfamily ATP-dependent carboligase